MKWHYPDGATPLDPDEIAGLIPPHITTHAELNEWEQTNILEAELWITQRIRTVVTILDQRFVRQLHIKMLNKTWRWAGQFRKTDKNIGIDWQIIPTQLQTALDDALYQIEHQSYSFDEIAARFHHRMVHIHPFVNGNGRHARLMTDALLLALKQSRFTWGKEHLTETSQTRARYIEALRAADKHDYHLLLRFVRS
jgi:Fic-DOC domain mobile mystery protein B